MFREAQQLKMSVKTLSHPGHGYPRRVEPEAAGLVCKCLKTFRLSSKELLQGSPPVLIPVETLSWTPPGFFGDPGCCTEQH